MNLFKKKVKKENVNYTSKQVGKMTLKTMTVEDMPTNAIEFTYEELMKKYQEYPDEGIQQKLVYLSKILTDRSFNIEEPSLTKEACKFFPTFTESMIDKMSENEKKNLQTLINSMKNMNQSITKLASKDEVREEIQKEVYEQAVQKPKFSLFKKKKILQGAYDNTIPAPSLERSTPLTTQLTTPLIPKQFTMDIQKELRIKETANKLREATEKAGYIFRKKGEEKDKPSFKNMEDVYCSNCKHAIKSHQNGCNKCGCLVSIEEIAEAHGIQLYKPKEVLQRVEEDHPVTVIQNTEPDEEVAIEKIIQKQASQLASMVTTVQKNNVIHNPVHQVVGDINCTCDHEKSHHYFNGSRYEFCTNNACMCSEFKPYP